jgi:Cu-Zn family superoxide dismutase
MKTSHALTALCAVAALAGCAAPGPMRTDKGPVAVARLAPTSGNRAAGVVWFAQRGDKVVLRGQVTGLTPNQEHGFHVHEKGDCTSADGSSAGGHLNPTQMPHGAQQGPHHAGDIPALKADASGTATVNVSLPGVLLGSGGSDFMGKALIVHAQPDDYTTQPTGNSGARVACGVIGIPRPGGDPADPNNIIPKEL